MKNVLRFIVVALLAVAAGVAADSALTGGASHALAQPSDVGITVPTPPGETWYVCQGYNTSISHKGGDVYGLDIVSDGRAVGRNGCIGGYNSAQHRRVYTPVTGTIAWKYQAGGLVCIRSRANPNISIKVGHMKTVLSPGWPADWITTPVGGTVYQGSSLGYVATPNEVQNGGVPHIHIGVYANGNCGGANPVPFVSAQGTALHGTTTWNLPSNGSVNQWSGLALSVGAPPPPPPPPPPASSTVVVDDNSGGFSLYGPGQYWLQYGIGYGNHMYGTWNNGPCSYGSSVCPQGQDVNYAIWRPSIPSSRNYRVCAYIPPDHAYSTNSRYVIAHASGTAVVAVNQQPLTGWYSLGVFPFNAGTSGYVRLGDWTGESFASRQIGFDAIKWVPDGGGC